MAATPEADADWVSGYANRRNQYEAFALKAQRLVQDLLEVEGIEVLQVEARVKSVESFAEKIGRKGYTKALQEATDLVGLRIITYYEEDMVTVGDILRREFLVHEAPSSPEGGREPDRFGYASAHYVISLSEARRGLHEWNAFGDLVFEVQVRTVLQHAWASISHKLDYKTAHPRKGKATIHFRGASSLSRMAPAPSSRPWSGSWDGLESIGGDRDGDDSQREWCASSCPA